MPRSAPALSSAPVALVLSVVLGLMGGLGILATVGVTPADAQTPSTCVDRIEDSSGQLTSADEGTPEPVATCTRRRRDPGPRPAAR